MNNYENYEKILNSFNIPNYIEGKEIIQELSNSDHVEARKLCSKYGLVNPYDYNRSCGQSDFIDIAVDKVNKVIQGNSKFIVSKLIKTKSHPIYLCHHDWQNTFMQIKDQIIDRGYFDNIKSGNKRVKGWFVEENVIKFGTKKTGEVKVILEKANINSLVKQNYYVLDKEHLNFLAQLSALGKFFGYESKIARKEKNEDINGINLNTVSTLTLHDLEINHLKEDKTVEEIDFIDVIWKNEITGHKFAFEVEFSENWKQALDRLVSLKLANKGLSKYITSVIVADSAYYKLICGFAQMERYRRDFEPGTLKFLPVQRFLDILYLKNNCNNLKTIRDAFFNEYNTLLDVNTSQLLQ